MVARKRMGKKRSKKTVSRKRMSSGFLLKRTVALAPQITGGTANSNTVWDKTDRQFGYFNFSLSDLPNNGEITAMFNRYKITGVRLKFIPTQGTDTPSGATNLLNSLAVQIDKSVRSVPASFDELLEAGNCRVLSASQKGFSVWIGSPLAAATIGGVSALMTNSWLDSDSNEIKHYGLRYAFQNGYAAQAYTRFSVFATYYLRLKGTK